MGINEVFELLGGLALFLFGMNVMSHALERFAGNQMKTIFSKLTSNKFKGFLLGLVVTALIQSSSATTVMVVGFVNSGIMTLSQSVGIIMGANVGAAVTPLLLSLSLLGDGGGSINVVTILSAVLGVAGVLQYCFLKGNSRRKNLGLIMIGFAVLMYGMDIMAGTVDGLRDNPQFTQILTMFQNPFMGVLVGTVIPAVIQSSGASIGILQALTVTGSVSYALAIPILMGQNIGTCISATLSAIGASNTIVPYAPPRTASVLRSSIRLSTSSVCWWSARYTAWCTIALTAARWANSCPSARRHWILPSSTSFTS